MSTLGQNPRKRLQADRCVAYFAGAAVVLSTWVLDAAVLDELPLETLAVRALWSLALVACGVLVRRGKEGDLVGSLSSMTSSAAIVELAWFTGGTSSFLFAVMAFVPLLIAQIEPERRLPLRVSIATILAGTWILLALEERPLASVAGWSAWVVFLGWWAAFWSDRLHAQRQAELEAERREAVLQRDRAVAEEERARALEELATAQLRHAGTERLAAVGRMAAGVAHEINNPLAYVKSNVELALASARDGGADPALLEESLEGLERICRIVQDLRGLVREPATEEARDRVEVADAVAEALRLASVRLRAIGRVDTDLTRPLPLQCTRFRLVQVLINLVVNAADALEQHGRGADGHIVVGACAGEDGLRVWVEDNGPGVPPEIAAKIFDPFFTTKALGAGMGIGLSLSQDFAGRLGGRLLLERSGLGGARFVLELPAARASERPAAAA